MTATVEGYPNRDKPEEMRAERIIIDGKTIELEMSPGRAAHSARSRLPASGRRCASGCGSIPSVETVHIVGIGLLFGSIAVLDLRLLGFSRHIPVEVLAEHVLPWTRGSFLLIVPSGLMMFTAHATDFIASPVFVLKMCLILAAGLNAAVFHAIAFPQRGGVGRRKRCASCRRRPRCALAGGGIAAALDRGDRLRAAAGLTS